MRERPILFSGPMVRAILAGSKTQTRRIVKPQPLPELRAQDGSWAAPGEYVWNRPLARDVSIESRVRCPYGAPGDRLWCREAFRLLPMCGTWEIAYRADEELSRDVPVSLHAQAEAAFRLGRGGLHVPWRPSIFMPRWASRLTLEVTGVRVERLHAISDADILAEGVTREAVEALVPAAEDLPRDVSLRDLWEMGWTAINGADSWAANPWVWVVSFRRVEEASRAA